MAEKMKNNKILFINCHLRSGSTLLGLLLGTQPDITYLGEVRNVSKYLYNETACSCGSILSECRFWSKIVKELDGNTRLHRNSTVNYAFQLIIALFPNILASKVLAMFKPVSKTARKLLKIFQNISKIYEQSFLTSKTPVICDSSHRNLQAKIMWTRYHDSFKIIHLIRDGRGVTNSIIKRTGCSMKNAAKAWKRNHILTMINQTWIPKKNIIQVKYEDICSNPALTVEKICNFVGITYGNSELNIQKNLFHFIGGSSTIRLNKERQLKIDLDEKWKRDLSDKQKRIFNKIAGRINRRYGYL
jgi:hypothetical protein